jgi:hypothetical protein
LIEKQEKLEVLGLYGLNKKFFKFDPKAPKGIKSFACWFYSDFTTAQATKFNSFMEPMCDSLMHLSISDKLCCENIELIINQIPKLQTLELGYFDSEGLNKTKLKSNKNILKLTTRNNVPDIYYLLLSKI